MDQAIDSAPAGPGFGGSRGNSVREWRECELQAVLPGFTSQVIELASRITDFANADVGTIVLHRLNQVEGFTISATSASAPAKAKKEYEKGRGYAKKEKWDAAQERFQKAVEAYPKYAVAWFELGRVQVQKSDLSAARQSFHQALTADSKFISPYQELANLAAREKQWQELLETTDQLLRLNPVNFPQYWMLNAAANKARGQHLMNPVSAGRARYASPARPARLRTPTRAYARLRALELLDERRIGDAQPLLDRHLRAPGELALGEA